LTGETWSGDGFEEGAFRSSLSLGEVVLFGNVCPVPLFEEGAILGRGRNKPGPGLGKGAGLSDKERLSALAVGQGLVWVVSMVINAPKCV